MAGGISKQGLYYIIGLLCAVVVGLFVRMMMDRDKFQGQHSAVQDLRIVDRDKFQAQLTELAKEMHATVAENGKAFWATQRELMVLAPRRPPRNPPLTTPEAIPAVPVKVPP